MTNNDTITTAADADRIRPDIETVFDGWFAGNGAIDWVDFLDRLENYGHDLGDSMLSPAVKRIRAIVRELRRDRGDS